MKRTLAVIVALALMFAATFTILSCTDQQRAKKFGGTAKIEMEPGKKLVIATWKDANLWLLTRPAQPGEPVETYEFVESSSFGLLEGKILIIERK
jgi:hypothetical protein